RLRPRPGPGPAQAQAERPSTPSPGGADAGRWLRWLVRTRPRRCAVSWLPPALAALGVVGLVLALVSGPLQRWVPLSEPLVALLLGVLAGPAVLGLVRLEQETTDLVLLEGSRVLLAASVMAAALRYPAS